MNTALGLTLTITTSNQLGGCTIIKTFLLVTKFIGYIRHIKVSSTETGIDGRKSLYMQE
jgi:hypothetical protein